MEISYRFVTAWTKNVQHYGSCNTSRVEGAHAFIKSYIQRSNLDLDKVFLRMDAALKIQNDHLAAVEASGRIATTTSLRNFRIFNSVVANVSEFALKMAKKQYEKVVKEQTNPSYILPPCTHSFKPTMGIPCAHFMKRLLLLNRQLALHDFDTQWQLYFVPERNLLPEEIPLPNFEENDDFHDEQERNDLNGMLEDEYWRHVSEAEERERLRANVDRIRDDMAWFTPQINQAMREG